MENRANRVPSPEKRKPTKESMLFLLKGYIDAIQGWKDPNASEEEQVAQWDIACNKKSEFKSLYRMFSQEEQQPLDAYLVENSDDMELLFIKRDEEWEDK